MPLPRFSLWRSVRDLTDDVAPAAEAAGFCRLWVGSVSGDLVAVERALAATTTLEVATGIVNIWRDEPAAVASAYARVEERHPGRLLLGIGVGHPEGTPQYSKPYDALSRYLDALDEHSVPADRRALAALGPRTLRLAAERSAGAHPYLVPPSHTAQARDILGPGALLAPEHKVVLDPDPGRARDTGRTRVATPYLGLVNYTRTLRRLGFSDDLAGRGSDALIDALVAHGDADAVASRLGEHLTAGADEVALQVVTRDPGELGSVLAELVPALERWEATHPA